MYSVYRKVNSVGEIYWPISNFENSKVHGSWIEFPVKKNSVQYTVIYYIILVPDTFGRTLVNM